MGVFLAETENSDCRRKALYFRKWENASDAQSEKVENKKGKKAKGMTCMYPELWCCECPVQAKCAQKAQSIKDMETDTHD